MPYWCTPGANGGLKTLLMCQPCASSSADGWLLLEHSRLSSDNVLKQLAYVQYGVAKTPNTQWCD